MFRVEQSWSVLTYMDFYFGLVQSIEVRVAYTLGFILYSLPARRLACDFLSFGLRGPSPPPGFYLLREGWVYQERNISLIDSSCFLHDMII